MPGTIIKEGWIKKRGLKSFNAGEFIKNWRDRYYVLTSDGFLTGFKDKSASQHDEFLNKFYVKSMIFVYRFPNYPN